MNQYDKTSTSEQMSPATDYEVKLEIFQGPLDLLVHLIRKNEVDIFDIPIATITEQYLGYLDLMTALNITIAGDFLVMASTLIHIKSKMLLPGTDEEEEEDPRTEITRPLLEYLRLKEVAGELSERDILDRDVFSRRFSPDHQSEFQAEEPLLSVNLFQLIDAFKKIIEQNLPGTIFKVQPEEWSLKDKIALVLDRLKNDGAVYFRDLFQEDRTISEFVITFLALLELVQMGLVRILQTDLDRDIRLEGHFTENQDNHHG